ncbi:MAG: DUF1499 domain-containing protein [Pseudomonadota bacterium]
MASYTERLMRVERPASSAARWSQSLALFCLPFLAIVIVGHRFGQIETAAAFWLLGLAVFLLLIALACGARGIYELWTYGRRGGIRSARGILLASILLLPFAVQAFSATALPPLYDISTDLESPPEFANAAADRTPDMNPLDAPTQVAAEAQLRAYPKVSARRYPMDMNRVMLAVVELMTERDWTLLTEDTNPGEAPIDEEASALLAKPVADARGRPLRIPRPSFRPIGPSTSASSGLVTDTDTEVETVSPIGRAVAADDDEEQEERFIEAVATSFIFGFESDIVVRLTEEETGVLVDMRSASRIGPHDLGSNAKQILEFMTDLDTALQGLSSGG